MTAPDPMASWLEAMAGKRLRDEYTYGQTNAQAEHMALIFASGLAAGCPDEPELAAIFRGLLAAFRDQHGLPTSRTSRTDAATTDASEETK